MINSKFPNLDIFLNGIPLFVSWKKYAMLLGRAVCISGSPTRGGGENVPGVWAGRCFTYLARGPYKNIL